ncbi:MAG: FtsX-like permease family protein [Pyrinomonadaceae bacterium]|nr:FtsX-like permease family protein [Pyrinomonadaceae bacterium]
MSENKLVKAGAQWKNGKLWREKITAAMPFDKSLILFQSIFLLSLQNLRANKLRTFLTLLGIIVGVAAIIAVVTIIEGLNQTVAQTFSAKGSNVFTLSKSPSVITSREEMIKVEKRKDVTVSDAAAVERSCRACWRVGYSAQGLEMVKHADNLAENVSIRGITHSTFDIEGVEIESGRRWTSSEADSGYPVALIGSDILKNVFNDAYPESVIGKTIRVRGSVFRVIGTVVPLGSILGVSRDNFVLIPYQTSQKVLPRRESLVVNVEVRDAADLEAAKDQVTTIMRARRGKITTRVGDKKEEDEGFTVETSDVFIGLYKDATDNIYLVTIGVSAISLVVGGIVVMNIMLVSVTERTKEIGLRKAVGARRRDILWQFLMEAVVVASTGGLIGVFVGFFLANAISFLIGFPQLFNIWSVILGVGVSSFVGIVSGIYPAWQAAVLHPIEAMRKG